MPLVFISYRRNDSAGYTGRIYDRLCDAFGDEFVFMDVTDVEVSINFVAAVADTLRRANIVLVMIANRWLDMRDERGRKRLNHPEDYVRQEIRSALHRNIPVIPVLLEDTAMPSADDLPGEIGAIAELNAIQVSHGQFDSDIHTLIEAIEAAASTSVSDQAVGGAFDSALQSIRLETLALSPDERRLRSEYWDEFDSHVASCDGHAKADVQRVNTLHYLAQYGLTIEDLRRRLDELGFPSEGPSTEYTDDVARAIEDFQRAHSLRHVDGFFGQLTYEAMLRARPKIR